MYLRYLSIQAPKAQPQAVNAGLSGHLDEPLPVEPKPKSAFTLDLLPAQDQEVTFLGCLKLPYHYFNIKGHHTGWLGEASYQHKCGDDNSFAMIMLSMLMKECESEAGSERAS